MKGSFILVLDRPGNLERTATPYQQNQTNSSRRRIKDRTVELQGPSEMERSNEQLRSPRLEEMANRKLGHLSHSQPTMWKTGNSGSASLLLF